jgi:D-alanyl-D-alanine carboxypeptidase
MNTRGGIGADGRMSIRIATVSAALVAALVSATLPALAKPQLLIDADSGRVLYAKDATKPWYPASLTKLMTAYVVLEAVREGRIKLTTPIVYSARAAEQKPSKWGLKVGTVATVDNVLKMMLVKSANDLAVMLAEGLDGTVEKFVAEMNATAARLGMSQTHFVNPNGWWEPDHVSSARDMAIVAQALVRDFPQALPLFDIRAVQLGKKIVRGHNRILGLFPGAEGMKTGFTCPSGFNLVALARRGDKRLIAVLMGYDNDRSRTEAAAKLLTEGFGTFTLWRVGAPVSALAPVAGTPPNLRDEVCKKHAPQETADAGDDGTPLSGLVDADAGQPYLLPKPTPIVPVPVFLGTTPPPAGPPMVLAGDTAPAKAVRHAVHHRHKAKATRDRKGKAKAARQSKTVVKHESKATKR